MRVDAFRSLRSVTPSTFMVETRSTSGILAGGTSTRRLCRISSLDFFASSLKFWSQPRRICDLIHLARLFALMRGRSSKYRQHTWQESSAGAEDAGLRLRWRFRSGFQRVRGGRVADKSHVV